MKNPHSAFRIPHSRGFTLVELLVVIGIIAALASLLLVGVQRARIAANEAAIQTEITQINNGFLKYTTDVSGGSYPPNVTWSSAIGPSVGPAAIENDFKRHFNAAFPKHREDEGLLRVLMGYPNSGSPSNAQLIIPSSQTRDGLTAYEAVVFWLGGFSDDPKYPISGPGGPSFDANPSGPGEDFASRSGSFPFDVTRIGPRTDDGQFDESVGRYITYNFNGQSRRINLWVYFPKNRTIPYVYFDASRKPVFDPIVDGLLVPIKQLKANPASPATIADVRYANEGKCQVLSAGLDDDWGDFNDAMGVNYETGRTTPNTQYNGITSPEGPFTGALADTITNFSTGRTLEGSQP